MAFVRLAFVALVVACRRLAGAGPSVARPRRTPPQAAPGQPPTGSAPEMRIAAVVNDDVISVFDVVSRMRMVMLSSNIPDTPEMRQRIGSAGAALADRRKTASCRKPSARTSQSTEDEIEEGAAADRQAEQHAAQGSSTGF